ncbi:MAG: glycine betaine/L-proline ABC transporter substrate-binding protein ProX [Nitriliruptoraceae bacterium]
MSAAVRRQLGGPMMHRLVSRRTAVLALAALLVTACGDAASDGTAGGGPGGGVEAGAEIRMARATWDTGFMQAAIYQQLLDELGYEVTDPAEETREPETFYPALARGDLHLWANGWFPLHEPFLDTELVTGQRVSEPIEPVGNQVPAGAVQGYLVDAATAEELDITSMDDFTRDEVVEAFDQDGDGKADLYGCNEGWGCNLAIEDHLAELEWGDSVEQVVGDYGELMAEAEQRVADGEPTLYYTWTPNWTVDVLVPGEDVVWVESDPLPDEDDPTEVEGLEGCAGDDPCELGWVVNDIRAVANSELLDEHPPVRRLLEQVEIPLDDIAEQNARMNAAEEYTEQDIQADAEDWIEANRELVDEWLTTARDG